MIKVEILKKNKNQSLKSNILGLHLKEREVFFIWIKGVSLVLRKFRFSSLFKSS